jgi:REP element-mobilizing transposase RayT
MRWRRGSATYELFLDRLGRSAEEFTVEVLAYCLMPNHFHVFLRTREANMSRSMQSLLTSYTVFVNRRDRTSGHIFQGGFVHANERGHARAAAGDPAWTTAVGHLAENGI